MFPPQNIQSYRLSHSHNHDDKPDSQVKYGSLFNVYELCITQVALTYWVAGWCLNNIHYKETCLIWDTWLGQRANSSEPDLLYFTKGISGLMVVNFIGQCPQVLIYVNNTWQISHWFHCLLAETCHLFIIMSNVFENIFEHFKYSGKGFKYKYCNSSENTFNFFNSNTI